MAYTTSELLSRNHILSLSSSKDAILLLRKEDDKQRVLSFYSRKEEEDIQTAFDTFPHSWAQIERKDIGTCATLDSVTSLIYVASADGKSVFVFRPQIGSTDPQIPFHVELLGFKGSLSSLHPLHVGNTGDIIVAFSDTGELRLLWVELSSMKVRMQAEGPLSVSNIQRISRYNPNTLTIFSIQGGQPLMNPISFISDGTDERIRIIFRPTISLPIPSAQAGLSLEEDSRHMLSACFQGHSGIILYKTGVVQIFTREAAVDDHCVREEFWLNQGSLEDLSKSLFSNPIASFRLSGEKSSSTSNKSENETGDILPLSEGYFAIAYGRNISVWDGKFGLGHGFVQLPVKIKSLTFVRKSQQLIALSKLGLSIVNCNNNQPLSLGLAIKLRSATMPIITDVYTEYEDAPYRAQALTTNPTKAVAEGHGNATRIFQRALKGADDEELHIARKMLNRELTPNAKTVQEALNDYTSPYYKLEKGDRPDGKFFGLKRLPSESLGALVVGRCLSELRNGNISYAVPMIDVIGTGVVSSEATLTMYNMSEEWVMNENGEPVTLHSLATPLLKSAAYFNVLEAIVKRVSDLPEEDLIQILYCAIQCTQQKETPSKRTSSKHMKLGLSGEALETRRRKLIKTCILSDVERVNMIESFGRFSLTKVIPILKTLGKLLNEDLTMPSEKSVKSASSNTPTKTTSKYLTESENPSNYRGARQWLDGDKSSNQGCATFVNCCIEWVNWIIDAQFTNLILDDHSKMFLQELLENIQKRKEEIEALRQIDGMINHLSARKPLPVMEDPLYKVKTIYIPEYVDI